MPGEVAKAASNPKCTVEEIKSAFEIEQHLNKADSAGYTALMHAAKHNNTPVVRWLIWGQHSSHVVDVNKRNPNDGKTAFVYAIEQPLFKGYSPLVDCFIDSSAILDPKKDEEALKTLQKNPLTYAVFEIVSAYKKYRPLKVFETTIHDIIQKNESLTEEILRITYWYVFPMGVAHLKNFVTTKNKEDLDKAIAHFIFNQKANFTNWLLEDAKNRLCKNKRNFKNNDYDHIISYIAIGCFSKNATTKTNAKKLLVDFRNHIIIDPHWYSDREQIRDRACDLVMLNLLEFHADKLSDEKQAEIKFDHSFVQNNKLKAGELARIANKPNCTIAEFKAVFNEEKHLNVPDEETGCTPLMNAVKQTNADLVEHMLFDDDYPHHQTSVTLRNVQDQQTALRYAVEAKNIDDKTLAILYYLLIKGADFDLKLDTRYYNMLQQHEVKRVIYQIAKIENEYDAYTKILARPQVIKKFDDFFEKNVTTLEKASRDLLIKASWKSILRFMEIHLRQYVETKDENEMKKLYSYSTILNQTPELTDIIMRKAKKELNTVLFQRSYPTEARCRFLIACFALECFNQPSDKQQTALNALLSLQQHLSVSIWVSRNTFHHYSMKMIHQLFILAEGPLNDQEQKDNLDFCVADKMEEKINTYEKSYFGADKQLLNFYNDIQTIKQDMNQIKAVWKSIVRLGEIHLRRYITTDDQSDLSRAEFYFTILNQVIGLREYITQQLAKNIQHLSLQSSYYPAEKDLSYLIGLSAVLCFNEKDKGFDLNSSEALRRYMMGCYFQIKYPNDFYFISKRMVSYISTYIEPSVKMLQEEKKTDNKKNKEEKEGKNIISYPLPSAPPLHVPQQLEGKENPSLQIEPGRREEKLYSLFSRSPKNNSGFLHAKDFVALMQYQQEGENDSDKAKNYLAQQLEKFSHAVSDELKHHNNDNLATQIKEILNEQLQEIIVGQRKGVTPR